MCELSFGCCGRGEARKAGRREEGGRRKGKERRWKRGKQRQVHPSITTPKPGSCQKEKAPPTSLDRVNLPSFHSSHSPFHHHILYCFESLCYSVAYYLLSLGSSLRLSRQLLDQVRTHISPCRLSCCFVGNRSVSSWLPILPLTMTLSIIQMTHSLSQESYLLFPGVS